MEPRILLNIYSVLYWFDRCYVSKHPNDVAVRLLIHRVSLKLLYAFEQHMKGPDTRLNAYDGLIPYRLPYVRTSCFSPIDNIEC